MLTLFWASATSLAAQDVIWQESFETDGEGSRYTTSSTFYDGSNDYFKITDGSDISITGSAYTDYDGFYFWAGEDLDDLGDPANDGFATKSIYFDIVNISSYTSLTFSGLFAAGHNGGVGASAYDDEDSVVVYYSIDGGNNFLQGLKFASTGDQSNEPLAWDTDFDGIGDSTVLSPALTKFSFSIPDADSVIIKISVSMNAGSEEFAFDHFQISGTHNGADPLPTKASFLISSDTANENSGTYALPVKIENVSDTVEVTIELLVGDTINITLFDEKLIFTGTTDTILYSNVILNDNALLDGNRKINFSLLSISGGYQPEITEPSQFTLFIADDDVPSGGEIIISEIMYDSRSSIDEEWVELYNTTGNPINISGWYLTDDDSYPADAEGDVVMPDSTIISAGEYLVFSWKILSDYPEAILLDKNSGFRSYAPGLINTGDNLAIYSLKGTLVDGSATIIYDDASPANAGYSIERDIFNGYAGEWKASVNDFNGSEIIKGTPGKINSAFYTSVAFEIFHKEVSEDSIAINIPVNIQNPSDTATTYCTIGLINGDSLEIISPAFQELKFPSGSSAQQYFTITIADDSAVAKIDTLVFYVMHVFGGDKAYAGADSVFQLIIMDNDFTKVNFTLDSIALKEGDSVEVDLLLHNPHPEEITIVTFADTGEDFTVPSDLTFSAGESTSSILIHATYDAIQEENEFVYLNLSTITGGNYALAGTDSVLVIKIIDDNPTQIIFADSVGQASEADGFFSLPVAIQFSSVDSATTATIALINGDTTDIDGFYENVVTFEAEDTAVHFLNLPITNDQVRESQEEFVFHITAVSGGNYSVTGETDAFTLTLNDDEAPAELLVINEILYDPPADNMLGDANVDGIRHSSEDEFIEIVNDDSLAVDLSGFLISDGVKVRHTFPAGTVVNPHQATVIFGGGNPAGDFGGSLVQVASSGSLSLNNTGDAVYLINITDTIASLLYSNSIGNDQSITRYPDINGAFVDHLSVSADNYSPGFQSNGLYFDEEWPDPVIHIDTTSFNNDFGLHYYPDTSAVISYRISVQDLIDTLFIESPPGFEVSTDDQLWSEKLSLINVDSLILYVRFIPVSPDTITYNNFILHHSANSDTLKLQVRGEGRKKPEPNLDLSSLSADFGAVVDITDSRIITYHLSGIELLDSVKVYAPPGFYISANNIDFNNTLSFAPGPLAAIDTTVYVIFQVDSTGKYSGSIKHVTQNTDTVDFQVTGELLNPVITVEADTINFQDVIAGDTSEFRINISASSLIDSLIISTSGEFYISEEENAEFSNRVILYPDMLRIVDQQIKVRFIPQEENIYSGKLLFSSYGADSMKIPLEGTSIQPEIILSENKVDLGLTAYADYLIASYTISGKSLADKVIIIAPEGIELSQTEDFTNAISRLELNPSADKSLGGEVYIGFKSETAIVIDDYISHSSIGSDTVRMNIKAERVVTKLRVDKTSLVFGEISVGDASDIASFTIKGESVIDTIKVIAPEGFEMDMESYFNNPTNTIKLLPDARSIEGSVYVRFIPAQEGEVKDSIKISGTGFGQLYLGLESSAYIITALRKEENSEINIYPVPADNVLSVQFKDQSKRYLISLFSPLGELINEQNATGNSELNTANLKAGIYHLIISDGAKTKSYKILISH